MAMFISAPDSGYLKGGWKPVLNSRRTYTEKWNLAGFLEFTDGDVVDHAVIKEETIEWARGDSLNEFAYDPWSATQFALSVAAEGVPIVEVPQTVKTFLKQ